MSQFRHPRPRSFAQSRNANPMQFGVRSGVYVLKRGLAGVEYVRPSWPREPGGAHETVLRILPGLTPDPKAGGPVFDPCRVSEDQGRYGSWQCCFEAVRKFGEPGVTMLLSNGDPSYDPYHQNPCWILYRAIKDAVDRKQARPEWYPLLMDSPQGKPLSRPDEITLVQALVFRYRGVNTFDGRPPYGFTAEDPLVVVELARSAAGAMFGALDRRVDTWEGNPHDPRAYEFPDITDLAGGAFVHLYKDGEDPRLARQLAGPQSTPANLYAQRPQPGRPGAPGRRPGGSGGDRQGGFTGYACHLSTTLDGGPIPPDVSADLVGHEAHVAAKVRPWWDILEFMSDVEQAHILNKQFPASAIAFAFEGHPEWVLPETRAAAVNAVSRHVPVAPPGAPVYDQPANAYEQLAHDSYSTAPYDPYAQQPQAAARTDIYGRPVPAAPQPAAQPDIYGRPAPAAPQPAAQPGVPQTPAAARPPAQPAAVPPQEAPPADEPAPAVFLTEPGDARPPVPSSAPAAEEGAEVAAVMRELEAARARAAQRARIGGQPAQPRR